MKTFEEWFQGKQGEPYNCMWEFAKEAWNASAENSAARIKELECQLLFSTGAANEVTRTAKKLAAQNQQMRGKIDEFLVKNDTSEFGCACNPGEGYVCGTCRAHARQAALREALALPDLASPVLSRVKAEALRAFLRTFAVSGLGNADLIIPGDVVVALHKMADAIEKGE